MERIQVYRLLTHTHFKNKFGCYLKTMLTTVLTKQTVLLCSTTIIPLLKNQLMQSPDEAGWSECWITSVKTLVITFLILRSPHSSDVNVVNMICFVTKDSSQGKPLNYNKSLLLNINHAPLQNVEYCLRPRHVCYEGLTCLMVF